MWIECLYKMRLVNFASARIDVMIHATENSVKVLSAIKNTLQIQPEEFTPHKIIGHFSNEIIQYTANLSTKFATDIAYTIITSMSDMDRLALHNNFDLYNDGKNSLYLRISKQKILEGKVILEQADSIKLKLKIVNKFHSKSGMEDCRKMLINSDDN